jgi:hypothetical protein
MKYFESHKPKEQPEEGSDEAEHARYEETIRNIIKLRKYDERQRNDEEEHYLRKESCHR